MNTASTSLQSTVRRSVALRCARVSAFLALLVVAVLPPSSGGVGAVGCNPGGPVIPTNAIAVAQAVAQTATTVVADAQAVWPVIYATIPSAGQAQAQTDFNVAVFSANHTILALDDAIAAAIAADTPNPDFTAIFGQLSDAVAQVVAIVQQFTGSSPTVAAHVRTPNGVDVLGDMTDALTKLRAAAKK